MKTKPEGYTEYGETLMTNCDHSIDPAVEKVIKEEPYFGFYAGWNFAGYVWWDREEERWYCEVWRYCCHTDTVDAGTLPELMELMCDRYGSM